MGEQDKLQPLVFAYKCSAENSFLLIWHLPALIG